MKIEYETVNEKTHMKYTKKLFKHGNEYALVLPKEFIQYLTSDEVAVELIIDEKNNPTFIVGPIRTFDDLTYDPIFGITLKK